MKPTVKIIIALLFFISLFNFNTSAQTVTYSEGHGNTLNLGLGIGGYYGYYGYIGNSLTVFHINYEFDVAPNFTLAPFATLYSYRSDHYRETVIPIGCKGSFYFDQILHATSRWDFYLAGSLGFGIVITTWDADYYDSRDYYNRVRPLFLDLHVGAEYLLSNNLGLFLDLSSGVSTLGLAIH